MSANSFFSLDGTFPRPRLSSSNISNSSLSPLFINCHFVATCSVTFVFFTVTSIILLLPLCLLVLYVGVRRWRGRHSAHGGTPMSHSDHLTYHMVTVELIWVFGLVFSSCGISTASEGMQILGTYIFCLTFPGQSLFHCLTCVERYLAVVHPITYMRQRERGGIRIRNLSIGCVWLVCFGLIAARALHFRSFPIIYFLCLMGFSIIVVLFCSLSVLRALVRPGPGDVGRARDGVDQSKQRAFHIITAILAALLLRFAGYFIAFGLSNLVRLHKDVCVWLNSGIWLILPSSLVLPLLFLHRAGKLTSCRQSAESG